MKTKEISSKAAVYPGLTAYSPYFNIGHDALYLEVGYSPDSQDYIQFCNDLLSKRLSNEYFSRLASNKEGLHTLFYAANGIPWGLIVMSEYLLEDSDSESISKEEYYEAIDIWVDIVEKFHSSLKNRLPRYTKFIDAGVEFMQIATDLLKDFNKNKPVDQKAVFYEIIEQDISVLPLSQKRIQSIKDGSKIRTIKDIIMDENGVELKKVKDIKGYWSQKIRSYAEEFIGG